MKYLLSYLLAALVGFIAGIAWCEFMDSVVDTVFKKVGKQ